MNECILRWEMNALTSGVKDQVNVLFSLRNVSPKCNGAAGHMIFNFTGTLGPFRSAAPGPCMMHT